MTANDRLEALVKRFNINIKTLSQLCGYDRPQAFYDIQKGKTKNFSPTMCDKILSVFPTVNRVWLLTGDGSMTVSPAGEADDHPARDDRPEAPGKMVPLVHLSAIAGPLKAYFENGDDLAGCERVYSPMRAAEFAVPVTGDSMEPLFHDGCTVYVTRINEAAFIPWGQPMVIDTENGLYLKKLMPDDNNSTYLWAVSENPKYPSMHIPKQSIYAIYRVLGECKFFHTL